MPHFRLHFHPLPLHRKEILLVCLFVCLFIYLLIQAGFSGSYTADVGLRPTAGFLRSYRVLIYRPTRGWTAELAVGLWCMVSTNA